MEAGDRHRWNRPDVLVLVALVAAAAFVGELWGHGAFDARNDAALYVLTARAIATGEGYAYLGEPFTLRPPGFSFLLAPLVGTGAVDFGVLNLAVRASALAAVALLFVFLRPRLGAVLAGLVAAAVFANRGFQTLANQVMSDVPGLALTLGLLVAARGTRGRAWSEGLLGVAVGVGALVRSAVLLVLPAVVCARLLPGERERDTRRWPGLLALVAGAVLVLAPWSARNAAHESPGPADQTFMHSYSTAMWHTDAGDPSSPTVGVSGLVERARVRAGEVLSTLGSRLARADGGAVDIGVGAVFLLAAAFVLLRRRAPAEVFLFGNAALLLVYFGFRTRLVLPLFALALAAAVETVVRLGRGRAAARVAAALGVVALGALDAGPPPDRDGIRASAQMSADAAAWIAENVPPGEVLAATQGWELGVHLAGRPVYSLQRAFRRDGPAGLERVIGRHGVRVCAIDRRDRLAAPIRRALAGAELLAELGDWTVLRLPEPAQ